jgi:hypothetical protein
MRRNAGGERAATGEWGRGTIRGGPRILRVSEVVLPEAFTATNRAYSAAKNVPTVRERGKL